MELVRALALRPETAWLAGMTALGHCHCARPRPRVAPGNGLASRNDSAGALSLRPSAPVIEPAEPYG
jgi:hypothetical protein